jgi:Alginate lyase
MPLDRRSFFFTLGALTLAADRPSRSLLMVKKSDLGHLRDVVAKEKPELLDALVKKALAAGPWSVTFHRPAGVETGAGPHDYFSEGPYWWPDPKNPKGPYIRRDGERNPERFTANHVDLSHLCEAVLSLGIGACLLDRDDCVQHASEVLSVWFVDPATRMNPNLEFGQAIRGVTPGRSTGIIDTIALMYAAQGILLLEQTGKFDAKLARALRQWYADYLKWLTTSGKGLKEAKSGNNHATWWTAQTAAYASFTGNKNARAAAWEHYRNYLVPTEIRPDGSCPREENRTQSLSYSSMNLDAFATICWLAQLDGVDLWHFRTAEGQSVIKSFHYLLPYVLNPKLWKKQQINPYRANSYFFTGLAGIALHDRELLSGYEKVPRSPRPWVQWVDLVVKQAVGV